MKPRFFTVEQANRALPLVRRIATDVVEAYQTLQSKRMQHENANEFEKVELERDIFELEGRIEQFISELTSVGCELKDVRNGLLDFYARNGKNVIQLCWQLGEDKVEFWHGPEGYRGRRPVSELPPETLYESPSGQKTDS